MNSDVTVSEVMDREFVGVTESDGVLDTVELLLREETEVAVVLRGQEPVGVLSDRDVLALLVDDGATDLKDVSAGDVMTTALPSIDPDASLAAARDQMATRDTPWLVVTDGTEPNGVITEHDVLTSSTLGKETGATEAESVETAARIAEAGGPASAGEESAPQSGFEDQSICEKCGSLTHNLTSFNGQMLCGDCRDI